MTNIGTIDRVARLALGLVLLGLSFLTNVMINALGGLWWLAAVAGVVMVGTAAIKFCPLYRVFGLRTCPMP
ncbi:MAG: DUF2892 domain-containing protein [Alphaproteobacteria bacterium]|nr:DUF2892 domain-containing protein [Alphaproteobacteria bacterium]TAD89699.1 MAG: DUF2892 domain-containing protein [Alphaproteobacteria bacterium]